MNIKLIAVIFAAFVLSACTSENTGTLPANSQGAVTVSGAAVEGQVLSSSIADANGVPSNVTYSWLAGGSIISGATMPTLTLTASEVGSQISVRVNYVDNDGFNTIATSGRTDEVTACQ